MFKRKYSLPTTVCDIIEIKLDAYHIYVIHVITKYSFYIQIFSMFILGSASYFQSKNLGHIVRNQKDCSKMTQNCKEIMKKDVKDNPWDVNSLDVFCNYNCPECGFKDPDRLVFRDHAIYEHSLGGLHVL